MSKKIISVVILSLILFNTVCFADFELGNPIDEIILSGDASSYSSVTLMLLNSDNLGANDADETFKKYKANIESNVSMTTGEIFYFATVKADESGKWTYKVPMNGIENPLNLTFVSSNGDLEFIKYAPLSFRLSIIGLLKEKALINDDCLSLSECIEDNLGYIAAEINLYNKLSLKKSVAHLVKESVLNLSEDSSSLKALTDTLNKAIIIEGVKEGKVEDFNLSISVFDYDENITESITQKGKETVLANMKNGTYADFDSYKKTYEAQLVIDGINYNKNMAGESLYKFLNENRKYLYEIDFSGFDLLSYANAVKCVVNLASKKSINISEFQKNLNDAVVEVGKKPLIPSGGGGGGGGGGVNTAPSVTSSESSNVNDIIEQKKQVYSDLSGYEWALDAVSYLSGEGILSGYETGEFKPYNSVTRAEFVKMIVATFYKYDKADNKNNFTDVTEDMWYCNYVNIAYKNGIINGTGDGLFSPDETISRQDMAVVIYNVAKKFNLIESSVVAETFTDDAKISDYAKEAVYALKKAGIINGVGNGNFAPKESSDRASAAQILYSLILSSKEAK